MTYTHITYPTGEEFLFNHGAMDDSQVCHGDLLAVNLRGQWVPEFYGFDYTVGQLPEKVKFSQVDRGITEDEDMTVSAIIFSSKSLQGSPEHLSGTIVGIQNSLGWQIIDPAASGVYRAMNVSCELEPGFGEDLYDVVENLNNCTITTTDLQSVAGQDLQM